MPAVRETAFSEDTAPHPPHTTPTDTTTMIHTADRRIL
jgi:hypothetical protein